MKTRFLALVMALIMALGLIPAASAEALPYVELDWYVLENTMPDNQQVFDKLNEYFLEKLNCKVNFHFYPGSEYASKMNTLLNNPQAKIDIVNTNGQLPYVDWTKKGAFVDIKELLPEYAPNLMKLIPEDFWGAMTIDGGVYGIPSYKDSVQMYCLFYNKTLAEELGIDMSGVKAESYKDIVPYMYEAYEKAYEKIPRYAENKLPMSREFPDLDRWAQHENISNGLAVVNIPGLEHFAGKGAGEIVFNKYDTAEYREMCKTIAQMVRDGVLPYDTFYWDPTYGYSVDGTYFLITAGSGYVSCPDHFFGGEYFADWLPFSRVATTNYLHQATECISANSKNPERALMVLDLINTDQYVATTLRFGIENVHWTKNEDGSIKLIGTNENKGGHYYWYGAQFGAITEILIPEDQDQNMMTLIKEANASAISDTNLGFIFDPTPVKNEIAACNNVIGEYESQLQYGYVELEDVDAVVDEFIAKLNANGAQKIVDEAQKQLDAWRAVNK